MIPARKDLNTGQWVLIIQKHHQRSGELTEGQIKDFLTSSPSHPHGIKVRLTSGEVGRVQEIAAEQD
jgi:uncharacterized repeat protein (TIGR03833 family)